MPLPIIYINSWPGVGKHTIAKTLKQLMHEKVRILRNSLRQDNIPFAPIHLSPAFPIYLTSTTFQVHNHHHIDLAGSILPRSSAEYPHLRQRLRAVLFDTLATCHETFDHFYIFTDFQTANESGTSIANEYQSAAKQRGCAFVPVVLTCGTTENERRLQSIERRQSVAAGKGMLLDPELLKIYRGRGEIYRFDSAEHLELDITKLSPAQAALQILEHVGSVITASKAATEGYSIDLLPRSS